MKERKTVTYEYKKINTKDLQKDELYQRETNPRKLMEIVRDYDPCIANAPKVSFRDNKYWVFDGAHTVTAQKAVYGKGKDIPVECKVFYGLTRLDEMELFVAQNGRNTPVAAFNKLRALYNFGDPDVVGMVKATEEAGCIVDFKKKNRQDHRILAIDTLLKIYLRESSDIFKAVLITLNNAWDGHPDSFVREMLVGMEQFIVAYQDKVKVKDLIKKLGATTPAQIVREAKSFGANTHNTVLARIILRTYNKGRRNGVLEDVL